MKTSRRALVQQAVSALMMVGIAVTAATAANEPRAARDGAGAEKSGAVIDSEGKRRTGLAGAQFCLLPVVFQEEPKAPGAPAPAMDCSELPLTEPVFDSPRMTRC